MVDAIRNHIAEIREKIDAATERAGRGISEVKLMAVTKTRTVEEMAAAVPWVDCLGENRVQEAAAKKVVWPDSAKIGWHLIGHLQSNKVRKALMLFDSLDSLDSVSLAQTVERIAEELERTVSVLIEVNTSGEASKTGVEPSGVPELLDCILACAHLKLEGFMTIGPLTDNESEVRGAFCRLREMASEARLKSGLPLPVLSMGMSGDFEWAVLEGSTMVRIGTSLFGSRM